MKGDFFCTMDISSTVTVICINKTGRLVARHVFLQSKIYLVCINDFSAVKGKIILITGFNES